MYTDPDGEFIVEAILIGAFINTYIQGLSGNINSAGDFFLSMAVGGLSGLAGAGIGHVMAGAVGTIGFAGGALTGASGGFAGGFVGGAGNAWVGGVSFQDGLKSGLVSGGIGAVTGGLVGGISGGITASKNGGNFWSGKGARLEVLDNLTGDIIVGDGMEYSNEYARGFSDEHFSDAKGVDNLFADGSFPEGYTKSGDIVYNASKESIGGVTIYNGTGKGSNVYLFKTSFTSMEKLYINMGHEYIHAAHFYSGLHNINSSEEAAYKWSTGQSKAFNYSGTKAYYSMWQEYVPYANSSYSFPKFGFYILSTKPW